MSDLELKNFTDIIFLGDITPLNESLADLAIQKLRIFIPEVFVTTLFQRFNSGNIGNFISELESSKTSLKDILLIKLFVSDNSNLLIPRNNINIIDLMLFNEKIKQLQTEAKSFLAAENPVVQQHGQIIELQK